MANKDDDKKIGAIGSSGSTKGVKATESLSEIDKVKGASGVQGVTGVSGVGKAGAIGSISIEQREKLMTIVAEEAQKLAAQGIISKSQREVVEQAVKMAIDASLIEAQEGKKR
jgi:hypothetical protein